MEVIQISPCDPITSNVFELIPPGRHGDIDKVVACID